MLIAARVLITIALMRFVRPIAAILFTIVVTSVVRSDDGSSDYFRQHIEPLLTTHCLDCHSHTSGSMENGLTLDSRAGWANGGDSGPAIIPGSPDDSLLIQAVRYRDPNLQMPPDEALPPEAVQQLERWVQMGAPDPRTLTPQEIPKQDWWSLQPIRRPDIPDVSEASANAHPIDAFINRQLLERGIEPLPQADRRTLIRRLTFDLHGLPPTPEEVRAFIDDDSPDAWVRLVDRLLDSPRYGERWARHWLDVVHFADSHGCEHDVKRTNAWRYRDYVIERLNADVPWAHFIREQLAADVFYPQEPQLTAALGFIGAGPLELSRARTAPVAFDYLDRDDMVAQTMSAFVSTTANCARCHAHKFDPVSQEDYYALQAVFAGVGRGDVEYDTTRQAAQQRDHWTTILTAAESRDPQLLDMEGVSDELTAWEAGRSSAVVQWHLLTPDVFVSGDGADLTLQEDGSLFAEGERPETDTYTITGTPETTTLSAIRLDVLADERLPQAGPGRQDNGNLHLSEVEFRLFSPTSANGRLLSIASAEADWNQDGWTIDHAFDGNLQTAWGIHPRVGESHQAVFRLKDQVPLDSGSRLVIVLKQRHGTGHLLGRFRLLTTEAAPQQVRILSTAVAGALNTAAEERTEAQRLDLAAWVMKDVARKKLSAIPSQEVVYAASAWWSRADRQTSAQPPKIVHLLRRGNIEKPVREVGPGALSAIQQLPSRFELQASDDESRRRAALADWIAAEENPLTWRSIVNRVWRYHFGQGLCATPNDLGRMGGIPSHPELLDWLAIWFRDDADGSLRQLHRLILTSNAWQRRSSPVTAEQSAATEADSDNRLLWRMNRQRLDAESIRDAVLQISGRLDQTMGGPGVEQFTQHKGQQLTPRLEYSEFDWNSSAARRRSIYRVVWRGIPDPFMEAMDFPDLGLLNARRGFSVSALQSLTLYNNDFVLHGSRWLAERLEQESPELPAQVRRAVELAWQRIPSPQELTALTQYARSHGLQSLGRVLFNTNEFLFID